MYCQFEMCFQRKAFFSDGCICELLFNHDDFFFQLVLINWNDSNYVSPQLMPKRLENPKCMFRQGERPIPRLRNESFHGDRTYE